MPPKKGRRGRRGDDESDEDLAPQASVSTEATEANQPQTLKKTSKKKQKKKNAKALGDWSDEDTELKRAASGDEVANGINDDDTEEIVSSVKQKSKKKEKAAKKGGFSAFSALEVEDDPEAEAEADMADTADSPLASPAQNGKTNGGFAALNGDAEDEDEEAESEAESPVASKQAAAGFAALSLDEVEPEEEIDQATTGFAALAVEGEEDVEEDKDEPVLLPSKKKNDKGKTKGKDKGKAPISEESPSMIPELQAALILSVAKHPNADKLKVCQVSTGVETFQVVTNAAVVNEGKKIVFAPVGSTTPGSNVKIEETTLRGEISSGMLCSAFDLGWLDLPDGVLVELPDHIEEGETIGSTPIEGAVYGPKSAPTKSKKKSKKDIGYDDLPEEAAAVVQEDEPPVDFGKKKGKKKKAAFDPDVASLASAALGEAQDPGAGLSESAVANGSAHAEQPANEPAAPEGKKKKKKASFDPDTLLAGALGEEEQAIESREPDASEAAVPEKKKKGKKKAAFDVDAALAEALGQDDLPIEDAATRDTPAEEAPSEALPQPSAAPEPQEDLRKGKKKKGKAGGGEEDLDALLAEFGVDTEAATESKKSKKKKKGKADVAEPGTEAAPAPADEQPAVTPPETAAVSSAAESKPDSTAPAAEVEEEDGDEAEGEGKELTAAQKKKLKKKAKDKAKKADADEGGGAGKKAGGKKESAAVRKLREEMERQRAAQEAAQRAEEERIRKEEEAARLAEEEAKRREEEKARRKEEKAKNRAELKRQGLLLTGKEKQEAERLAAMREQFLKNNPGAEFPTPGDSGPKKRPVYGKKKAAQKKQEQEAEDEARAAADKAAAEAAEEAERQRKLREREAEEKRLEAEAEAKKAAEAQAAAEAEMEEESDDAGWDDLDLENIKLPGQESPEPEPEEENVEEAEEDKEEVEEVHTTAAGKAKAEKLESSTVKKAKTEEQAPATPSLEEAEVKAAAKAEKSEEESDEDDDEEDEDSDEESDSSEEETDSDEDDSSEYTSSDESMDSEEAREERLNLARQARAKRMAEARQGGNAEDLRSPICCILGHVDTGKTKLLDNIRRTSVQEGEAGGITQQIGATYVPGDAIKMRTEPVRQGRDFGLKLPGLLIIDTPDSETEIAGHESFTNLRSRGSSLCDIAILVVDIMHGLEPQTIESINLLKQKKTPFIVALNKVDRLFEWESKANTGIRDALQRQQPHVNNEFETNLQRAILNLNEQGLNVALYWKNPDPRKYVNIVPTSAISGEGIPDMLQLVVQLTQKMMAERLMFISELQCTVLEVKVIEGLGTTIDVVLVNGLLKEGDQIVLCGLQGPIVTTIRSLLTPHPLKELRVRGSYLHHKEIKAAQGIKIAAPNLESAVAGTQMLVVQKGDSIDDLKAEVMGDMTDIFKSVDKTGEGVCVQASTLGSLEALLEFLRSDAVKIPVSGINIGPVHKRDVMRASTMLEKGRKKFAVILAFDVPVTREAQEQANSSGVRIFTADIIYHLFDQFSAYLKFTKEEEQQAAAGEAVFPVELKIMPTCIFNTKDPIILGCTVEAGIAKVGTPLCVPGKGGIMLGKIASMEINHKAVEKAKKGDDIALKIEATNADESAKLYGRHFDFKDMLVSKISRRSIDLLKLHFKDQLERPDWQLVVKLKKVFGID